ncbi:hypothetical protein L596_001960 [Steinernema carpocapsae]|uniref:Uncharacterized protein n=1 Tax=Steinernema carpocapsae TaxID=34508 RepID=A0A4U8URP5_STECR|nr:hypothetical protein L596_001960 [Steinernema carpocapsae]
MRCSRVVEYCFKYVLKGGDRAYVKITIRGVPKLDDQGREVFNLDEIEHHFQTRYVTSMEAVWRLIGYHIVELSHEVQVQYVYKPGGTRVVFQQGREAEAALAALRMPEKNMLTDFFKLCAEDAEARKYCYQEVALHYAYSKKKGWKKRKRQRKTLVRVQSVLPRDRVGFALRLLLLTRPGPTSYQWLRTVNGVEHNTFAQAAIALNLMESDSLWLRTLQDASNDYKDKQFRRFFAQLMFHSLPSNPEALLAAFIDRLCPVRTDAPDFASRRRRALIRIAYYLQEYNVTLYEVGFDVPRDFSIAEHIEDLQRQDDEEEQQMLTVLENGVPRRRTWQEVAKTERAKLNQSNRRL